MKTKNSRIKKKTKNKIISKSVLKITTLFIFVAVIAMLYQNSMTSNIVADNNRQSALEKLETVKGSKLKIGDYVNYDHTIQVDPNTKETVKVSPDKLKYTSVKGDLEHSGNGKETQTVDVTNYQTKWRVFDIQGDQVLLIECEDEIIDTDPDPNPEPKPPEPEPYEPTISTNLYRSNRPNNAQTKKANASNYKFDIALKGALGYLWWEKEVHNVAELYGHGYGADETKKFNYEVGSRIPSEGDTRTETKTGTGARPMLLSDIEETYGITTDEQRQELSDDNKDIWPVGSNNLENEIYYPTLNKENARATEEKIDNYGTGDIGVSKTPRKLTDIKNENYYINKLDKVHTKTYDANTGKDIQKEIIHSIISKLGTRGISIYNSFVEFSYGVIYDKGFTTVSPVNFANGTKSYFESGDDLQIGISPVVFLSSANNYYKEKGEGEYATYSLIKGEKNMITK